MATLLALLGIVLALAGAIAAMVGSIIAAPLEPGYVRKIRALSDALSPFVWSQRNLADYFLNSLKKTGAIEREQLDASLLARLETASEISHDSDKLLQAKQFLDFSEEAATAATARMWLLAGALCAFVSAICQIGVVIVSLSVSQSSPKSVPAPSQVRSQQAPATHMYLDEHRTYSNSTATKCWTGVAVTVLENGELIGRDPVNIVVRGFRASTRSPWASGLIDGVRLPRKISGGEAFG